MLFRAVGNRCAVNLDSLCLPLTHDQILDVLRSKDFTVVEVDIIALARSCVGTSRYRRAARSHEAPAVVDCSGFIKWLYGQRGIWLPRRSIQQVEYGQPVMADKTVGGDVIFTTGRVNYYRNNPAAAVGHVGIVTDDGTVIHAANSKAHIQECSLTSFIRKGELRSIRRYIPLETEVITLETPSEREIEIDDDLRWVVLQTL